jgi:Domain of unknown function (DUF4129)
MLLALLLAATPCALPQGSAEAPPRREAACALLARPAPRRVPADPLEAIYLRPGFERARQPEAAPWASWLAQLRARLLALLETRGAERYSSLTRVAVLALALAAAAAAVLRARRARAPRRPPRPGAGAAEGEAPAEALGAALRRARDLAGVEPREAIRAGLVGLLGWLEARRLTPPGRARTNLEVIAELPARGAPAPLAEAVEAAVGWYDAAFYSLQPVTTDEALRFLARLESLDAR